MPPCRTASEKKPFPPFPGMLRALGPGIVWLALAQGSGELIWWPYLIAKYGLGFLILLVPACLLQLPLNYEIGRYTLLTGESIFRGFIRMNRAFAFVLWALATLSFLWFGAFAGAGGTALAALTGFPHGWTARAQTLFWAYVSMAVLLFGALASRVVYRFIEKFMWAVSLFTLAGLAAAVAHPEVRSRAAEFFAGIFVPRWPAGRVWESGDLTKLLTAVTFAGLGGFWTLFYSYWLKEKGAGMAAHGSPLAGALAATKSPAAPECAYTFEGTEEEISRLGKWKRFLAADVSIGIFGNIATTLMTCLLAYALLFPKGLLPEKYEIAVVQARFFEASWGAPGRLLFLFAAACFLSDTWISTLDAVSRMQSDFARNLIPALKKIPERRAYFFFLWVFTAVTCLTLLFREPGTLILLSAVIGFVGTVAFSFGLIFLNHGTLRGIAPRRAWPGRGSFSALTACALVYLALAAGYFGTLFGVF